MSVFKKFTKLRQIIAANGGYMKSLRTLLYTDELKIGKLIGEDQFGNKYYQNNDYFMGRSRWVEYSDRVGFNYDGSQVPPEWHRWLHSITDEAPSQVPLEQRKWMLPHKENKSGTPDEYMPYSTRNTKILAWKPDSVLKK